MENFSDEDRKRLMDTSRGRIESVMLMIINAFYGYAKTLDFDMEIDEYEHILKTIICETGGLELVFYDPKTEWFYTVICDDIKLNRMTEYEVEYSTPLPFKTYGIDGGCRIKFGERVEIPKNDIDDLYNAQRNYSKLFDIIKTYGNAYFSEQHKDTSLGDYTAINDSMRVMDLCNTINIFNTMEVVVSLLVYFKMAEPNRVFISDFECIFYDSDKISAGLFMQNIMYIMSRILEYEMNDITRLIFSKPFVVFNLRKPNKQDIEIIKKIEEDEGIFIDIRHCYIKDFRKKSLVDFMFLATVEYQNL